MKTMTLSSRTISTELPALVMGIVNATPDSFWRGSRGGLDHALALIDEGADVLDIGGESTRPGSEYVSADEEISRVVPLIREIRRFSSIPISVDTRKAAVMRAAFEAGADILNDISALSDDDGMAPFCAESGIPVVLMHKRGIPSDMQKETSYADIFREVSAFLEKRAEFALNSGVKQDKIWVDPGIGFGKDTSGNLSLVGKCGALCGGKYPVLMALSRKSCIGEVTGRGVEERLFGTLAADLFSVMRGASMVRVHDVAACVDSLRVWGAILKLD